MSSDQTVYVRKADNVTSDGSQDSLIDKKFTSGRMQVQPQAGYFTGMGL